MSKRERNFVTHRASTVIEHDRTGFYIDDPENNTKILVQNNGRRSLPVFTSMAWTAVKNDLPVKLSYNKDVLKPMQKSCCLIIFGEELESWFLLGVTIVPLEISL